MEQAKNLDIMSVVKIQMPALVAVDSFKSTISASAASAAICSGLSETGWKCLALPVADGGEGTLDAVETALGLERIQLRVSGPLGDLVEAEFGFSARSGVAVVEMARASGLELVKPSRSGAWAASSRGTGELIRAAVEAGATRVIVGAGGSASSDGGRGAVEALGASFKRDRVDVRALKQLLRGIELVVACDVRNCLLGPAGAAYGFALQKGADPATVKRIERRLTQLTKLATETTGRDPSGLSMTAAGGGLAAGLWSLAGAQLRSGAALVLQLVGFDKQLKSASFVVTGEGTLDTQTLNGKAAAEIAIRARQAGVPTHAIVGRNQLDAFGLRQLDLQHVIEAPANSPSSAKRNLKAAANTLGEQLSREFGL